MSESSQKALATIVLWLCFLMCVELVQGYPAPKDLPQNISAPEIPWERVRDGVWISNPQYSPSYTLLLTSDDEWQVSNAFINWRGPNCRTLSEAKKTAELHCWESSK